jgi:hypothetical protein
MPRSSHFIPGKDPVPIVQEAGWAQGPVWIGAENFAPTEIRSPDLPARRESLKRLSYPGPHRPEYSVLSVEHVGLTSLSLTLFVFPRIFFLKICCAVCIVLSNIYSHKLKATSFSTQTERNVSLAHYIGDGIPLIDTGF